MQGIRGGIIMSKNFKTVYIVRWVHSTANVCHFVGVYNIQDEALTVAKAIQEKNPDGLTYVETVIVPAG